MSTIETETTSGRLAPRSDGESSKRRDILDGARRVFFEKGFDGASMDEVAKAAGVSKATIYVHFGSKEELFSALVHADRSQIAEQVFEVDLGTQDVAELLHHIGVSFISLMVRPDHIRMVRMVIGVAEKFPRIGQTFFDAGPCHGGRKLGRILREQADLGRLEFDDEVAAAHLFLSMCHGPEVKGLLFGVASAPTPAEIDAMVARAVRVFLSAYGKAA